jgi:hypothetical protein
MSGRCSNGVGGASAATMGCTIAEETSMTLTQASRRPLPVLVSAAIPDAAVAQAAGRRAAPPADAADGHRVSARVRPCRRSRMPDPVGVGVGRV